MAKFKFSLGNVKFNLTSFFAREADIIIRAYQTLLQKKQGVALDYAPSNKPSTIRKKGFSHWLKNTGKTIKDGFSKKYNKNSLEIYASVSTHPNRSNVKYEDIFDWHNTANNRYSGVFGQLPANSKTIERMGKEIDKQVVKHILKNTPKKIKIKFGKR